MKAWQACTDWSEGSQVVFAETRNQARVLVLRTDALEDEEYKDIRAYRLPLLDGMENEEPSDNLWLNEKVRTILVKEYGWQCTYPNEYEPCEECCAKEYCFHWENMRQEN